MNKLIVRLFLVACVPALFSACSDKSSTEACRFDTTRNLDKGNYDAVLTSPCADPMQMGAAYFGKAGFDIKDVVNRFSQTGALSGQTTTTGTTSATSDLNIYMTALIGNVNGTTLTYLDDAKTEYDGIPTSSSFYLDAQFYSALIDAMKGLTLLKLVLPNITTPNGTLDTTCDNNGDGTPDDADATACALLVVSGQTCTNATVTHTTPLTFPTATGTTYDGLTITILQAGTGSAPNPPCPANYRKLLFQQNGLWIAAVTNSSQTCTGSIGGQWPCPIIDNGQPLDLVTALDASISSAVSSMSTALPISTATGSTTDVQTAIQDVKTQACPTPCPSPCTAPTCPTACQSGAGTYCTSQDLAAYIQTNLK